MTKRTVIIDVGWGPDVRSTTGHMYVQRFYPGPDGTTYIHAAPEQVELAAEPTEVDLTVSEYYTFTPVVPRGVQITARIQTGSGSLLYKDLVPVDPETLLPIPDFNPIWAVLGAELGELSTRVDNLALGEADDPSVAFQVGSGALTGAAVDARIADGITGKADLSQLDAEEQAREDGDAAVTAAMTTALTTKADLVGGTVPANQLPSFVDDVLEFANLAAFPATGVAGKIYVAQDTNLTYRWGGSSYGVLDPSLALGENSTTAYRGDRGKTAFDHSQATGNPHSTTATQVPFTPAGDVASTTVQGAIAELASEKQAAATRDHDVATDVGTPASETAAAVAAKIADAIAAGDFATAAQLSAGLALKANATDVYTKTAADTLLGAKADLVGGLVPTSQIPGVALTTGQAVANRAAMLALTNVQEGDIVSITATSDKGTYLLGSGSRSLFASWLPLSTPTDVVTSVQGQQGVVIIGKADIGLTNVDNTSDVNKPVSTAAQAALDAKAEDAVVTTFGTGGNQAYAIPVGAKTLDVFVLGGGGGGGSGRRGAAGTIRCGGGSGSSGGYTKERINVAELTAAGITTLYLDVGVGGDGGAGQASDNTDGNNGTAGVGTYLKRSNAAPTVANIVIWANSGNPGNGGTATAGTGGSAGNGSQFFGVAGVAASAAGLVGLGGTAGSGGLPGSGASGGGLTAANAASNGGSGGGSAGRIPASGSSVGIAPGGNGGDAPTPVITGVGNGGGGGASHSAGAGGRGGNAVSGGGGGGGGASVNGSLSGAGGNGGNGLAQITANF